MVEKFVGNNGMQQKEKQTNKQTKQNKKCRRFKGS